MKGTPRTAANSSFCLRFRSSRKIRRRKWPKRAMILASEAITPSLISRVTKISAGLLGPMRFRLKPASKQLRHRVNDLLQNFGFQHATLLQHQITVRCKKLSRSGLACSTKSTLAEALVGEGDSSRAPYGLLVIWHKIQSSRP